MWILETQFHVVKWKSETVVSINPKLVHWKWVQLRKLSSKTLKNPINKKDL